MADESDGLGLAIPVVDLVAGRGDAGDQVPSGAQEDDGTAVGADAGVEGTPITADERPGGRAADQRDLAHHSIVEIDLFVGAGKDQSLDDPWVIAVESYKTPVGADGRSIVAGPCLRRDHEVGRHGGRPADELELVRRRIENVDSAGASHGGQVRGRGTEQHRGAVTAELSGLRIEVTGRRRVAVLSAHQLHHAVHLAPEEDVSRGPVVVGTRHQVRAPAQEDHAARIVADARNLARASACRDAAVGCREQLGDSGRGPPAKDVVRKVGVGSGDQVVGRALEDHVATVCADDGSLGRAVARRRGVAGDVAHQLHGSGSA